MVTGKLTAHPKKCKKFAPKQKTPKNSTPTNFEGGFAASRPST